MLLKKIAFPLRHHQPSTLRCFERGERGNLILIREVEGEGVIEQTFGNSLYPFICFLQTEGSFRTAIICILVDMEDFLV